MNHSLSAQNHRTLAKTASVVLLALALCLFTSPAAYPQSGNDDTSYDLLFLSADGPLWIQLKLAGADSSLHAVRLRYASLLIRSVDEDGDGFAGENEARLLTTGGRPSANSEVLGDRWIDLDVSPHDGKLSADELLADIDDLLGPRFTTRRKPPLLVQSVQLLPRLDRDGDRQISAEEIRSGTETLRQFDFDDDGTFSPAELQPFPQNMVDAAMAGGDGDDLPFILVDENSDLAEIAARVVARYGTDGGIPIEQSGLSEFAFQEMDGDGDGRLSAKELAGMLSRPRPVVIASIDLARGRVVLERARRGESVEVLSTESERRLSLRLGSEVVEFSARDNRYLASDQINLLRIRFLQGDGDKNGYMGPDEFMALTGIDSSFEDVDADDDGKVFLDELDRFIRLDSYLAQCAVEMEVETVEKPLFRILDDNLDRRLTAREFAAAQDRLEEYDSSGDGILDAKELDLLRRFRVRFGFVVPPAVRPERTNQMAANRRMPVTNRMTSSGPEWFQNMDRNQDGEVTWREFLGPRDSFDRLDADGSGWVDESEAEAAAD